MLVLCSKEVPPAPGSDEVRSAQRKSLYDVIHELVRQVTSPNTLVREQVSGKLHLCVSGLGCVATFYKAKN